MSILVTGGAGYIGSHTVRALAAAGKEVVVVDDLSRGHRKALPPIPFYVGDLRDRDFLNAVFAKHKIEAVIHFAALSLVGESVKRPDLYFNANIGGTLSLLDVMQAYGASQLVFSSSAAVYGEPKRIPIPEDHPQIPRSPYGESKLFIEKILKRYEDAFGLRFISLRYFNAAGADPSGEIGEDHHPETHLIPLVLETALGQREKIQIFGTDYPTADGTCIRDYIHVNDLSEAHLLALKALAGGAPSRAYNLGNGQGFSVREVIRTAEEVVGMVIPQEEGPRRPGDPAVLVASSDRIQKELKWRPKLGDLKTILETAWHWHKNHPQGFADREAGS